MNERLIILDKGPHHIAVFKPHNMTVIGGPGVPRPTLLDLVREHFGHSVYPVHRLDRVTAGITLFARSVFAKHAIDNAFKKRLVTKIYYALCEGQAQFKKITVDQSLQKIETGQKKGPQAKQIVLSPPLPAAQTNQYANGKQASEEKKQYAQAAVTNFRLLKNLPSGFCLIEAQPLSGRMHQIRAHLAGLGLVIVGDKLYGAETRCAPQTIALCAVKLSLPLPKGGRISIDASKYFRPEEYLEAK